MREKRVFYRFVSIWFKVIPLYFPIVDEKVSFDYFQQGSFSWIVLAHYCPMLPFIHAKIEALKDGFSISA